MNKIEYTVIKSIYFHTNEDVQNNVNKQFKLVSNSILPENYKCFKKWIKHLIVRIKSNEENFSI